MTPQEQIRRFFRALLSSAAACWTLVLSFLAAPLLAERPVPDLLGDRQALRTIYQQAGGYSPRYDIKADGVMVYGVDEAAVAGYDQWRRKSGSIVRAMTGVAWGNYDD